MTRTVLIATFSFLLTAATAQNTLKLSTGWRMQSSTRIFQPPTIISQPAATTRASTSPGAAISRPGYPTEDWYHVTVPTTVIAGLLANNVYNFDPFMGMNFEKLKDPILDSTWWFRRQFTLPASDKGKDIVLKLHGINYKANVWLNGKLIADSNQIMNPYRIIELDITKDAHPGRPNVLALEIRRPINPNRRGGDLAIDYADWIHYPPDYNCGIINDIEVLTYDRVGIQYPLVTTHFDQAPDATQGQLSLDIAHLTVDAFVTNYSATPQDVIVKGRINNDITFRKKVHLEAKDIVDVTFTPADFPQLNVKNPRIWWPWQYGKPELNHLELSVLNTTISENFGIRRITTAFIDNKSRVFIVNGKRIVIRGAAWSPDIFQRRSPRRQEQEIRLYRDMNMNTVRSEGKLEDDNFYALCDKYGMLVMTGWMCCGAWQYPELWDSAKRASAMASDSSVMLWLRNKPSIMVWLNGSDMPPRDTTVERDYLNIESALKWPNPTISTANESKSLVSGYSGVKMDGPYDWVPPIYWETDSLEKHGGAYSFATEISPGPSIPPYESLIKFIPEDSLWFTTATWKYHCGIMNFGTTNSFDDALQGRYGTVKNIWDYIAKAQAQNYEAHRAMMEAYGLHKYHTATGVIQWMGSNPWPGLIWHTYDYYLYPAGTYFGMKKSLEPLHIMYSYATQKVFITNTLQRRFEGLKAEATLYDLDGARGFSGTATTTVEPDSIVQCFDLSTLNDLPGTYFLRLQLTDAQGEVKSINWYWLSKKPDVLDWKRSTWYMTPETSYTDYSALQTLGKTSLKVTATGARTTPDSTAHNLTITNTGNTVAFQVHLRALKGPKGDDILPLIFSDNYLELAPGETRTIRCAYANKDGAEIDSPRPGSNARATATPGAKVTPGSNPRATAAPHPKVAPFFRVSAWNLDPENSKGPADVGFAPLWVE